MIPRKIKKSTASPAYLVLENIRSSHNVGSLFRTADAVGVDKIFLVGYTPLPIDEFGRANPEIAKTALGAEHSIPWEFVAITQRMITKLKKEGVFIAVLEQAPESIDYKQFKPKGRWALFLGNEVSGVSGVAQKSADAIVEIPMAGKKESLNVSVAGGVALFRILGK